MKKYLTAIILASMMLAGCSNTKELETQLQVESLSAENQKLSEHMEHEDYLT